MVAREILRLKQGVTLALDLLVTDDLGSAVNLSTATANVVVCDALGNAVATLPMTPAVGGLGWATVTGSTAAWPVGRLMAEVQVTIGGTVEISDTFSIVVERPVSQ